MTIQGSVATPFELHSYTGVHEYNLFHKVTSLLHICCILFAIKFNEDILLNIPFSPQTDF